MQIKHVLAAAARLAILVSCIVLPSRCLAEKIKPVEISSGGAIRFDFSPSFLAATTNRAESDGKEVIKIKPGGEKNVLLTRTMRSYARPGDRWFEVEVKLSPQSLNTCQLTAEVFPLGSSKPAAQGSTTPARNNGTVLVDLRQLNLSEGRLLLKLMEGEKTLGISEMFLTAQNPEQPIKAGEKIKVMLDVPAGVTEVKNWPVTFGVPFAAGTLWDINDLRLVDKNGKGIPAQVEAAGLWAPEGAVKWARVDALVSSADGCFMEIGNKEKTLPKTPLTLTEKEGKIIIDTGVSTYVLGKGISPIKEIFLAGKRAATCEKTRGLYVVDQNGQVASASADKESMGVEASGPVSACVRFEGYYKTEKGENLARHITRVECFAGQAQAKVTHTLVLCNDTGKVWFKDIGWEFAVESGNNAQALFGVSRSNPSSLEQLRRAGWQKTYAVPLNAQTPSAYMFQDEHYFFAHGTNHFVVAGLDSRGKATKLLEGEECGDFACLAGANNALLMSCRDTALQHPKEFEVSAGKITLHLFSNRAGEELDFRSETLVKKWDLVNWFKATLAVNQKSDAKALADKAKKIHSDAIGWAKTHALLFAPLGKDDAVKTAAQTAYLNTCPVFALMSPQWTYKSKVFGPLHPKDSERFPEAEKYIDATFRVWEKRMADWGDYSFMYYFTGPHLAYRGKYVLPKRYCLTYTLRPDFWRAYARSGDRSMRELADKANLAFGDSCLAHWDGNGKTKGLFNSNPGSDLDRASPASLPFQWVGPPDMEISSSSDMNNFIYHYYLTGNRRMKEIVEEYSGGIKKFWTPEKARSWRGIMLMRMLVQGYSLTWDPALREMAEATTDTFVDPKGAIGLSKERPYSSTTYKTRVDILGLFDAWEILGNPRYYDLIMKIGLFWWRSELGDWPIFYVNTQGNIGNFLYNATGNPAYAEMLALQTRQAASNYNREKKTVDDVLGAHESTFVFQGIPYSQDLMVRTGADKNSVASWVAYADFGYPSSIVIYKSNNGILNIGIKTTGKTSELKEAGAIGGIALRPAGIGTTAGLDLNSAVQRSEGTADIHVPKDAPEGAYEILVPEDGSHIAVADQRVPMVVYAPDYWRPATRQAPLIKWYFNVPTNSQNAQLFLEEETRLYAPDGKLWPDGKSAKGWINLPADKPGLWAFEPGKQILVRAKNIPPFFAARDPQNYFEPPIAWEKEKPYRPPEKPAPGTVYVPGVIQTPDNKALYLDAKRKFILEAGLPPVANKAEGGDGSQFLPFKEGTIEFFIKPTWSTFDLPSKASKKLLTMSVVTGETWSITYTKDPQAQRWLESHVLYGCFMTDGPFRRKSMRTYRQTIIPSDEWIHVAWVWGPRTMADFKHKSAVQSMTAVIFINGKQGKQYSYGGSFFKGHSAADLPKTLVLGNGIEAAFDELRVSDVQRYTTDFTPPSNDREITVDKNTRALFHFNGNSQGESLGSGHPVPVMGEIK